MYKVPETTESEFDIFMKQISFSRVSDDIIGSPSFKNADYISKERKIIIELKVIEKDHFSDGGIIDSLNAFVMQPCNIKEDGTGQYVFKLPKKNREGTYDNLEEPLRRILKNANKQLKETKKYYQYSDALGFVIIAQTGMLSIDIELTAMLVKKILDNEFRSIDGVILCSPYGVLINPFTVDMNNVCASITKLNDGSKERICMDIANSWVSFFEKGGHQSPIPPNL